MPFRLKRQQLVENDVETACLDLLRYKGYWPIRLHVGVFRTAAGGWLTIGERGTPDWCAIHGRHRGFLLEVKRPGREPSPEQLRKIDQLRRGYGLEVAVVDSSGALKTWLETHERSP